MGIELDKEDLFGDSASNRLLLEDDKSATIFAAFNAVNNLQRTLVETVNAEIKREGLEEDLKSIREKTMEKLVVSIKSKGEKMSIDEVIGEALEASTHFVGKSIETGKRNIITSEIVEKSNKIVNAHKPTEVEGKVSTLQERIIAIEKESFDRSNQEVINSVVMLEREPEVSKEAFELSLIAKRDEEKVRISQQPIREPKIQLSDFIELKQNGVAKTNHPMKNYTYVMYDKMNQAKFAHDVVDMNEAKANLELNDAKANLEITAKQSGLVSIEDSNEEQLFAYDSPFAKTSLVNDLNSLSMVYHLSQKLEVSVVGGFSDNRGVEIRFNDRLNKWFAITSPLSGKITDTVQVLDGYQAKSNFGEITSLEGFQQAAMRPNQLVSEGDFKLIEGDFDGHKVYSLDFCMDNSLLNKDVPERLKTMDPTTSDAPSAKAYELQAEGDKDVVMTVYAIGNDLVGNLDKEKPSFEEPGAEPIPYEPGKTKTPTIIVPEGTFSIFGVDPNPGIKQIFFAFNEIKAEQDPEGTESDYYLTGEEFTFRKSNLPNPFGQPWKFSYGGSGYNIKEEDLTFDGQNTPIISIRIDGVPTDVKLIVNWNNPSPRLAEPIDLQGELDGLGEALKQLGYEFNGETWNLRDGDGEDSQFSKVAQGMIEQYMSLKAQIENEGPIGAPIGEPIWIAKPIGDVSEEPIAKPIGDVSEEPAGEEPAGEEPKEEPKPIEGGDEDPAQIDNGEKPQEGPIGEPIGEPIVTVPIGGEPTGDDGFDVEIDFLNPINLHGDGSEHKLDKLSSMLDHYEKMIDLLKSDREKKDNLGKDYDSKLYDSSLDAWKSYHKEVKDIILVRAKA